MSNIKKKDKYKKSENMSIRLTVQEKEKIEREAKRKNMSVSNYLVKKATDTSNIRSSRENERICQLVWVENAKEQLEREISEKCKDERVLEKFKNLNEEIRKLWQCL